MLIMQFIINECSEFKEANLFIVADGMGGGADGEVASSIAIRSMAEYMADLILSRDSDLTCRCVFTFSGS